MGVGAQTSATLEGIAAHDEGLGAGRAYGARAVAVVDALGAGGSETSGVALVEGTLVKF